MLSIGTHRAKAIGAKLGTADTGTEQVAVEFVVTEGPDKGKRETAFLYFTEKTTDRTMEALEHCGWDGESLVELKGLGSKECVIVVDEDEYEGKKRNRIRWVNAGEGVAMKNAMSPEEAEKFNHRMKAEILRRKQSKGQPEKSGTEFNYGANAPKKDGPPV